MKRAIRNIHKLHMPQLPDILTLIGGRGLILGFAGLAGAVECGYGYCTATVLILIGRFCIYKAMKENGDIRN